MVSESVRAEHIKEIARCGSLEALKIAKAVSNLIAEEIEAHAEFLEIEGDIYGMGGGLRKAAAISRKYKTDGEQNE